MSSAITHLGAFSDNERETPLDRNSFAQEFSHQGDTIRHHERYTLHIRKILAEEENFFGLLSVDLVEENRENTYRNCNVTPSKNHPFLLFYFFHSLHEADKLSPINEPKYLPDRPDLDKLLALLHDEGEDIVGFQAEDLEKKLNDFLNNIRSYVEKHNRKYSPLIEIPIPSPQKIEAMRNDIPFILKSFDALTHGYKGEKNKKSYYQYHVNCLEDARAARVKSVDKTCNVSTLVFRGRELIGALMKRLKQFPISDLKEFRHTNPVFTKYRNWVLTQMSTARNLYFSQKFKRPDIPENRNKLGDLKYDRGFIDAAIRRYPENKKFYKLMKKIMKAQLDFLDHNVANEKQGHDAPDLDISVPKYENLVFSPRINLLQILKDRFKEVMRIDDLSFKELQTGNGMYDIPLATKHDRKKTIILKLTAP